MKVKYIRVSTQEQNTSRQETNTKVFDKIYVDKISGALPFEERPEGRKLYNDISNGAVNEVHVSSIDRIGRDILNILMVCEYLTTNKVNLYVENIGMFSMVDGEPNPIFKMIVSVLGNVAEMERSTMLERQKQGIMIAKAKGFYTGRLYGTTMSDEDFLKKYKKVAKEIRSGESLRRSASLGKCSLGTAQKVKRLIAKDLAA